MSKSLHHESAPLPHPIRSRVVSGAFIGLIVAAFGLMIGVVRLGLALLAGRGFPFGARDVLLLASYPVGFIVAGAVVGALYPLRRHLVGALLLGVLGSGLFFGTMFIAWKGNPLAWRGEDWLVLGLSSVLLGFMAGFQFRKNR